MELLVARSNQESLLQSTTRLERKSAFTGAESLFFNSTYDLYSPAFLSALTRLEQSLLSRQAAGSNAERTLGAY